MGATKTTINKILKDFYQGSVRRQLNDETAMLDICEKAKYDWSGRRVVFPLHVARNSGVGTRAESATLPTSGSQGYVDVEVFARYTYGTFSVTGPAKAAAKKGSKYAFVSALGGEMDRLKTDVRQLCDKNMFSGWRTKGFICDHKVGGTTTAGAAGNAAPGAGSAWFSYDGDYTPFQGIAAPADWVRVFVTDGETYDEVVPGGVQPALFVSAIDEANQRIQLSNVANAAGQVFTLAGVTPGRPVALHLHATAYTDGGALGTTVAYNTDPMGIYANLADPSWIFTEGFDRSTSVNPILGSSAAAAETRAVLRTVNRSGNHQRVSLTLMAIQRCFDEVFNLTGEEPGLIVINPLARSRYIALVQAIINSSAGNVTKADGGFKPNKLSYGEVKFKPARRCGQGLMLGLHIKSWKFAEQEPCHFADDDGSVLSRVTGKDEWEGFMKWYYNHICEKPRWNFVLCGFDTTS